MATSSDETLQHGLCLFLAGTAAFFGHAWGLPFFTWVGLGLGGLALLLLTVAGARRAAFAWRFARAVVGPDLHGEADFADARVLEAAGLTGRHAGEGLFLGAFEGRLLFYQPETHLLTLAPAGLGKTSALAVPNVLHCAALAPSYGMTITDKDGEIAAMCWEFVHKRLPASVCVNPFGLHGLPDHHFNPLGELPGLAHRNSPEIVEVARGKSMLVVPEPAPGGENKFFRDGARELGTWPMIFLATDRPGRCTLPDLYDAVNGGDRELLKLFLEMQASNAAGGQVARAGKRFEALMRNAERTFQGQLSELQQGLALWDGYSTLGRSSRRSDFAPSVLKDGPAVVFIVMPEDKVQVAAKHIALVVDALVSATMKHRSKQPRVVFLLDEFQRLPVMPSVPAALYRGRGSGLTLWPIVQDGRSLKAYGPDESAFRTQADVIQMFGVRDAADAEYLATRIGQTTLHTASVSAGSDVHETRRYSVSHGQQAAPRLRKDEILQTQEGRQYIVYRNRPVILADIVRWWEVAPWRKWPAANPKEGAAPKGRARYFLRYRGIR